MVDDMTRKRMERKKSKKEERGDLKRLGYIYIYIYIYIKLFNSED